MAAAIQAFTLFITLVGGFGIFLLRPAQGLVIFAVGLFCYPQDLTVKLGVADFGLGRLLILFIWANILLRTNLTRKFKWKIIDTFMILSFLGQCVAYVNVVPAMKLMEKQGGKCFDTLLVYFAVRFIIREKSELLTLIKGLVLMGVALGAVGVYQSLTWHNPLEFLKPYYAWGYLAGNPAFYVRHGLYRADVTFGQYIGFGMFFAALAPTCLGLFKQRVWSPAFVAFCFGALFLGVVSSMSSGPLFSVVVALAMVAGFRFRQYWKPFVVFFVVCCVFLEFFSHRHFYEVPTRFAFSGATASYRIGLYHEAFGLEPYKKVGMEGHWLFGYGMVGVHKSNDNTNFHWYHKDFTSIYIGLLARTGLFGLVPFLIVTFLYFRSLYRSARFAKGADAWLLWCFSSALVGWGVGTLTVALVAQTNGQFYMMLGMAANMPLIMRSTQPLLAAAASSLSTTAPQTRRLRGRSIRPRRARRRHV